MRFFRCLFRAGDDDGDDDDDEKYAEEDGDKDGDKDVDDDHLVDDYQLINIASDFLSW